MQKFFCDICKEEKQKSDLMTINIPAYQCYDAAYNGEILKKHITKSLQKCQIDICESCAIRIADQLYSLGIHF